MTDRILLNDLTFFGYHGVRAEEKSLGQRFRIDLALALDLRPAGRADRLDLTLDYGEVYRFVRDLVEGPSRDTLEAVAEDVAASLLDRYARLETVDVTVTKLAAPIPGAHGGTVAVAVSRGRAGGGTGG